MDARLSALLDKQEIEEVVLRYCRGIDRRDFELVRGCYHADARDHHGSFSGSVDEYIAWVDKLTARYRWSMHLIANVFIELGEADIAACETYGVSLHRSVYAAEASAASAAAAKNQPPQSTRPAQTLEDPKPYMNLATGFRYLDRFERRAGAWKIAERTAVGEWSMKVPRDTWWDIPETQLSGKRDKSDALYALLASLSSE